ncbi:efflux RND transporter permease subunit [Microbaculum marinum]|uniref:Efflux RND transporter permease subunit n=1 Tax=Microbaculum marinum TaxID=1764581 RepID=A0AAW9RL44_9HYPH
MAEREAAGPIRFFVRHRNASNLLMAMLVLFGVMGILKLNTQLFPSTEIPRISVTIAWSGASAEDIEQSILHAVEPELRYLDDLDRIISYAREGAASITLEYAAGTDMQIALAEVESAIAGVTTLPEGSETPVVRRSVWYEGVANIAISGPFTEDALKAYAKEIRDGLLNAGIDKVDLVGFRKPEVWVDVEERELRRLGVTLSDIAARIAAETRDLPSGTLEGAVEKQLRSLGEGTTAEEIGAIETVSRDTGEKVLLREIADVHDSFEKDQTIGYSGGNRAIELQVERSTTADTLETAAIVREYLEEIRPTLPPTLDLKVYDVRADSLVDRINLLVKNGVSGLVIVVVVLFLFLNARIAFWVAAGIPVAMMATLGFMWVTGQSINMISLFALIMCLGIVVDDAIVVGEHTATRYAMGDDPVRAAERGAGQMMWPVIAAVLTTQVAFFPLTMVRDVIGQIMGALPLVVIAVLTASLLECVLILPGHLRHSLTSMRAEPGRFRRGFDRTFAAFRDGPFRAAVGLAFRWRYTTLALSLASLIVVFGLIAGGRVGFQFFPTAEPENITASLTFAAGTPEEEVVAGVARVEAALAEAERRAAPPDEKLVVATYASVGRSGFSRGMNFAEIDAELTASEVRSVRTNEVIAAWREAVPRIPGLETVTISGRRGGPPGRDIDIRLTGAQTDVLKRAALEIRDVVSAYPGVSAVDDDLPYGKPEIIMELTPRGAALGFTAESVGEQVRNAFEGAIARRVPAGDEEVTIRVRRVQAVPGLAALGNLSLRAPSGEFVPLSEVVDLTEKQGYAIIQRIDGQTSVSVTADVDQDVTTNVELVAALDEGPLRAVTSKYGIDYAFSGREEEREKSFADLQLGAVVALGAIYLILAWVFASYGRPLAVMAIIPFGLTGAVIGHMVMGVPLTILSLMGLLGLSGILVNDSIILVSRLDERLDMGETVADAAVSASCDRLRAVLLTSLTTIGGLAPLMFETSLQAQFLIPMAVTLVFGLAVATFFVLFLVPAIVGVGDDVGRMAGAYMRLGRRPTVTPAQ